MNVNWSPRYDYNEENVKRLVRKESGNYLILVKLKSGDYRVIYVGKCENLEKRLLEHISESETNKCLINHITKHIVSFIYAYINSEEDRKNIEYTLYKKYNPECNEQEPEGKIIEINFPI